MSKGPLPVEIDMKFAMNSLVAAAALATVSFANAAVVTGNLGDKIVVADPAGSGRTAELSLTAGSGTLAFSSGSAFNGTDPNTLGGLLGALNVGQVVMTGVGGAVVTEGFTPDEFGDNIRTSSAAKANVVAITADNVTGQILSVGSTGGALQTGSRISGTLTGGSGSVTNLRFDLANKKVYADLSGTKLAVGTTPAINYSLPNTALWTIGTISGPTVIPPAALLSTNVRGSMEAAGFTFVSVVDGLYTFNATNVISGLKVTTEGFDFFKNSLGLLSTGVNALAAVNNDAQGWGQVTSNLTFTVRELGGTVPVIPEPSTYMLMGLGLAGIAVAARRRAAK